MIIIVEKILNILYPQVCGLCGKLNKEALCNKCKILLQKEYCFQTDSYINDSEKFFIQHTYFFKYKDLIRNQLISYKFNEKVYIYKTISKIVEKNRKDLEKLKKYDIIIVVPISKRRKKDRGYNQSELIAKEISNIIDTEIYNDKIIKVKNTISQSLLTKEQRKENVKGVYKVVDIENLKNKKILIFDDIFTTGNTVNECAKVLVLKGINRENIGILTIAKD